MAATRAWVSPAVECGAWLALAAGMWAYSYRFDGEFPAYLWGPVSWPRAVLAVIVVLALAQLALRTVLAPSPAPSAGRNAGGRKDRGEDPQPPGGERQAGGSEAREEERSGAPSGPGARWRTLTTFTLPLLYLMLLPRAGYFAATPLFLAAYMLAFRERSLKYMLATTALLYVGSLAVFSKLLFVPLPTGNWPGFYDFSNRLLEILHAL